MVKGRDERGAMGSFLKCISVFGRSHAAHTSPFSMRFSISMDEVGGRGEPSSEGDIEGRIIINILVYFYTRI
jgi:hypothetical protein